MKTWANGCDACVCCPGCARVWCREQEVSPGEGDGLCVDCFETELPGDAA